MASKACRIALILASIFLFATITNHSLNPGDDPYRCKAAFNTGRWVDPPDKEGNRKPFKQWQPDGCKLRYYNSADIRQCMDGRHIMLSGDSTTRQIAYAIGRLLDRDEAMYARKHVEFHSSFNWTYHGVQIQLHWRPFLKIYGHTQGIMFLKQLELIAEENDTHDIEKQKSPGLAIIGAGAWFAKPEIPFDNYSEALANISTVIPRRRDYVNGPMDIDGIGNHVFFAPPNSPYYAGEKEDEIEAKNKAGKKIIKLQKFLESHADEYNFHLMWVIPELVTGQDMTRVDQGNMGYHVVDEVAEIKAHIILNVRCNARLDRIKGYPYSGTCCTDYGNKPIVQLVLVGAGLAYLTICVVLETLDLFARRTAPCSQIFNMEIGAFVLALLLSYFADRTHIFAKGEKVWSQTDFTVLCAPCALLGLITIRKSATSDSKQGALNIKQDQQILSRDQTEEWKGWMQFLILAYHWTGAARSPGIYVLIRLLVAAYLFQTGYGHTTFFLLKKDFTFKRYVSVMLRLNLLSVSLSYFMNTEYMFYYFSPLVSFWFSVVWLTLWWGHEKYNNDLELLLAKICVSAGIVAILVLVSPVMGWIFTALKLVFHINWDLKEWNYRLALDLFIVYIGMIAAVASLRVKEDLKFALRAALAFIGLAVMGGYGYACTMSIVTVADYRLWHPYVSFIPIMAFIAVRNVDRHVRNYYSKAMAWLGKCSLETYTLQFHLFLAADTHGILLLDCFKPGNGTLIGDRWRAMLFIIPVFVWVSYVTANATRILINIITTTSNDGFDNGEGKDFEDDSEPFLSNPESSVFGRSRSAVSRYMKHMPSTNSVIYSLQMRILLILLVLWMLNLLSPMYDAPVPDSLPLSLNASDATGVSAT